MADARDRCTVVVDVHEGRCAVPDALEGLGATLVWRALPVGDYVVGSQSIVERKAVADLHDALLKGRLWPQLYRLRTSVREPWLIVEGTSFDAGPAPPDAIRGALIAAAERGIRLLRSESAEDTARWLHRLATRRQRAGASKDRPAYAQRPAPSTEREVAEAMLAAIPGISTVSARALLDRFGSIAEVIAASPEALRDVPGIGSARANALRSSINFSWQRQEKQGHAT